MLRRKRRSPQSPNSPKFSARAERLSTEELQDGVEQSLNACIQYWQEYRRTKNQACLVELQLMSEAMMVLAFFLDDRNKGGVDDSLIKPKRVQPARQARERI